jgi:hypothetical protein
VLRGTPKFRGRAPSLLMIVAAITSFPWPPAHASTPGSARSGARPFEYTALNFIYDKNNCVANCGTPPKLRMTYGWYDGEIWHCCTTVSKTGGSGARSGDNKNDCAVNVGWIPDTDQPSYDNQYWLDHYESYPGSLIHGTAWLIMNSRYGGSYANCDSDSSWERSELLIHSEMTGDHEQDCSGDPDDPWCWDGQDDYYSLGCIKVSWNGIHGNDGETYGKTNSLDWYWHNRGGFDGLDLIVDTD